MNKYMKYGVYRDPEGQIFKKVLLKYEKTGSFEKNANFSTFTLIDLSFLCSTDRIKENAAQ